MKPLVTVSDKILAALESGPATDLDISKVLRCTRKLVADIRRHLFVTGHIKQAGIKTLKNGAIRKLWCLSSKPKTSETKTSEPVIVKRKNDAVSNLLDFVKSYPNAIKLLVDEAVLGDLNYKLHEVYTTVVNIIPQVDKLQDLERRLGPQQNIGEAPREAKDWCGQPTIRNVVKTSPKVRLDLTDKKALHHNYVVLGKSTYELAKMSGTYPNKVRRALFLAGIKMREYAASKGIVGASGKLKLGRREKGPSEKSASPLKVSSSSGRSMYKRRKRLLSTPEYRKIYEFLLSSSNQSAYQIHRNSPELNINQVKNGLSRMLSIGLIQRTGTHRDIGSKRGRALICWSAVTSKNITDIFAMSVLEPEMLPETQPETQPEMQPENTQIQNQEVQDQEVVFQHPQEVVNEILSPIEG